MDLTSLDFQQARIKLVVFKSRLRSVLYGVREPEEALFSVWDNPFGQWVTLTLVPRYGLSPEIRTIERVLHQMLHHGHELVRNYQQGRIEEARAGLEQIEAYATSINQALHQLEQPSAV